MSSTGWHDTVSKREKTNFKYVAAITTVKNNHYYYANIPSIGKSKIFRGSGDELLRKAAIWADIQLIKIGKKPVNILAPLPEMK